MRRPAQRLLLMTALAVLVLFTAAGVPAAAERPASAAGVKVPIAVGMVHRLAIRPDGAVAAWGYNLNRQCDAPGGNDFVAVACPNGGFFSLALRSDGALAAWGENVDGQCNVPAGNDYEVTP